MDTTAVAPQIVGADSEVFRCWSNGHSTFTPDERDIELLAARQQVRASRPEILEGDYVEFADGVKRRVSHVWQAGVQTSDSGSWYLSVTGFGSFSGGLCGPVKPETLTDTKRAETARFWFFHRDYATAHNAVHVDVNVRVWACSENAPR